MSELAIHHQQHIRHEMRLGANLVKWPFVLATSSKEPWRSARRIELVVVRTWLQLSWEQRCEKRSAIRERSVHQACWKTDDLDDAGEKPPHALLWDIATVKSAALKSDAPLTCGTVVGGKLWVWSADGKTLTMSQYD